MAIFDPLQNRHPPLTDCQKMSQVITSATPTAVPNLLHIRPCGFLGEWVKYNLFFNLYPSFRKLTAQDGSNDADSRKNVPFWVSLIWLPIYGGQIPPNPNFGDVNRHFQAKLVKSKNMHIIKTTASIPTKFCTAIKTTKYPSWVVRTHT